METPRSFSNLIAMLLLTMVLISCSKDRIETLQDRNALAYVNSTQLKQAKDGLIDPQAINFFNYDFASGANSHLNPIISDRNENELLNGLAYELLRLNQAYNIVPSLISKVGYPYWSHSEIFYSGESGQQPVVLLPFTPLTSDSVEAVLFATPLTGSEGWYTTLYTRKQIDSLITTTVSNANSIGFKVATFVFLDYKLFGKKSKALADWVIAVLEASNLTPATDRCGIVTWCFDILPILIAFNDTPVSDRTEQCWHFIMPCSGSASSGSGSSNCALDENFQWVCDYMNGNWEANGGGSGGGSSPTNPGNNTNTDIGTDILNLYNNGQISEEVMNQLLTVHSIMGLNDAQATWLLNDPAGELNNRLHLSSIESFLLSYGHEEGAKEHAKTHLNKMMVDAEYREMATASFGWTGIVWTIAKELFGDALVDLLLNQIPFFNKQDEIRDIIKSAKNNDWLEFSYEVTKLVFKTVLKNNPYAKAVQAIWEGSEKAARIGQSLKKVETLIGEIGTQAVERAWGILKKMGGKLFEIEDLPQYLKYIEDLKTPRLGGYFATEATYNPRFKAKFNDISDEVWQVHHAIPKKVKNIYGLIDDNQLHSLENLRGIPINDQAFHQDITNMWSVWYTANPNFTLQNAMDYAKEIDDLFGHRFIPPIR